MHLLYDRAAECTLSTYIYNVPIYKKLVGYLPTTQKPRHSFCCCSADAVLSFCCHHLGTVTAAVSTASSIHSSRQGAVVYVRTCMREDLTLMRGTRIGLAWIPICPPSITKEGGGIVTHKHGATASNSSSGCERENSLCL